MIITLKKKFSQAKICGLLNFMLHGKNNSGFYQINMQFFYVLKNILKLGLSYFLSVGKVCNNPTQGHKFYSKVTILKNLMVRIGLILNKPVKLYPQKYGRHSSYFQPCQKTAISYLSVNPYTQKQRTK